MSTAAERLADLRERVRAIDAKRAMIVGEAICSGVLCVPVHRIESIAALQEDQRDRYVLALDRLELHGWRFGEKRDGTRVLSGVPSCPILPERAPRVQVSTAPAPSRPGPVNGSAAGGGGSASTPARSSSAQREDARAWEEYYEAMADWEEWPKHQARRAYLLGSHFLDEVLQSPKLCTLVRESGIENAAEFFPDTAIEADRPPSENA